MKFIELTAINDLGDAGGPVYVAVDRINCLVPEQFGEHDGCTIYIDTRRCKCYETAAEIMAKIEAAKSEKVLSDESL